MDIKIEDCLDEQEIKEICKDALYQKIREDMRKLNVNDIIANISYAEVAAMVDTCVGEDNFCKKEIPQKVHRVIDELSTYTVFRKLEVALNHRLNFLMAENGEYDHYTSGFDEAVTRVENFPAADVAPVRHGRWTFGKDLPDSFGSMNKNKYHLYCSECRNQAFNKTVDNDPDFDVDTPFCPWCGAKMDGERKENDNG